MSSRTVRVFVSLYIPSETGHVGRKKHNSTDMQLRIDLWISVSPVVTGRWTCWGLGLMSVTDVNDGFASFHGDIIVD